jgi:hypothetical protein
MKRPLLEFERRHEPVIPWSVFLRRLVRSGLVAAVLLVGSLALGVWGYHALLGLGYVDALLNASMLLGGMGPVAPLDGPGVSKAAKLFASFYALFSGVMFLTSVSVFLSPALHRLLHHFHVDAEGRSERSKR